jgi:two-component system response regulator VanR
MLFQHDIIQRIKETKLYMGKILVVDDEKEIADLIEIYLLSDQHEVVKCYSSTDAIHCIRMQDFELAILDVMMPEMDGYALCKEIRKSSVYPIIMLTAKDSELDKINGLTLGADDYMTKPFKPLELLARVKAQLRRYKQYSNVITDIDKNILQYDNLQLNIESYECYLDDKLIALTPTEFAILRILLENQGKVVSVETLLKDIWKGDSFSINSSNITVHVRHLREKLHDIGEKPVYIKTVWGIGYKI